MGRSPVPGGARTGGRPEPRGRLWPTTTEFDTIASVFPWTRDARGVGDDAALVGKKGLLCCDALAEGVHFRRDWSSFQDIGWKAVAQNVADIYAMGGHPTEAVWSVGLGADWSAKDFRDLARGALEACERFGCRLVGGDTVRTKAGGFVSLALSGTLVGKPWLRSGAKPGDRLVLVGTLGLSAAGLALLQASSTTPTSISVRRHRRPEPPREGFEGLLGLGSRVHAAIDVSDGLSSECHHLALASGLALRLDLAALPRHPSLKRAAGLLEGDSTLVDGWILHGGEEHSLLVALDPRAELPVGSREIGRFSVGEGVTLVSGEVLAPLPPGGWTHS
jgi:thiamine-monophosphate kinase